MRAKRRYSTELALLVCELLILCAGCQSWNSVLGYEKEGKEVEFSKDGKSLVKKPFFEGTEQNDVNDNDYYLDLEWIKYLHPVSGEWVGLGRRLRGDEDEELCLFLLVVTYKEETDLSRIVELFKRPLKMERNKITSNKHDWFVENFNLANLPEGAEANYWLGYNGKVETSDKKIMLDSFTGKGKSVRNGPRLWPIKISGKSAASGVYVYMKIIVLEETGHEQLRKIWKSAGGKKDFDADMLLEVLKDVSSKDFVGVARLVAGWAISKPIEWKLKKDGLVDLEYAYESDTKKASSEIPLLHRRYLSPKKENIKFELKLKITEQWKPPLGDKPLTIERYTEELN